MMNTNSLTFYIKSFDTYGRDPRQYSSSVIYRFLYFYGFFCNSAKCFLLSMISIQYILIVALISFLSANVLLSIGLVYSMDYNSTFVAIGDFTFFTIFDASKRIISKRPEF